MKVDVPKLKFPFAMQGSKAALVEQDSIEELAQCAYAIFATEQGSRIEEPEFGIPDQAHRKGGVDEDELLAALAEWEPRIDDVDIDDTWEQVKQRVRVLISG